MGFFAAAIVATATAATVASGAMQLFGPSTATFFDVCEVWFASDALGVVTVAPLLIGVATAVRDAPSWRELLEGTVAVVVLTSVIGFLLAVFSGPWSLIAPSAIYFPLLLWLVSRCHPVFAAAAVFTIAGAIVWTTTHDIGRYGDPTQPFAIRVLAAQVVMLSTTLAALAFAAIFAERRKQEAAIAERDAQLALAGKTALVGTYALDVKTGRAHPSAGYAAIYDLPEGTEEYGRDDWLARMHPDDRAQRDELRNRNFAERRSEHKAEYRILRQGEVRWIEERALISYDGEGRPQRMVGINIDVTERTWPAGMPVRERWYFDPWCPAQRANGSRAWPRRSRCEPPREETWPTPRCQGLATNSTAKIARHGRTGRTNSVRFGTGNGLGNWTLSPMPARVRVMAKGRRFSPEPTPRLERGIEWAPSQTASSAIRGGT